MTILMREFLSYWPHGTVNGIAMFLFAAVFFGAAVRVYGRGGTERCAAAQGLPLEDLKPVSSSEEREKE